jgi:hypothetical protein
MPSAAVPTGRTVRLRVLGVNDADAYYREWSAKVACHEWPVRARIHRPSLASPEEPLRQTPFLRNCTAG